jgi:hypothetical protein
MPEFFLDFYVIFKNPRDYPKHFVVRQFCGVLPTMNFAIVRTLEEARRVIPEGWVNIGRFETDEPQIVEVWI